jgi:hypothetical protein
MSTETTDALPAKKPQDRKPKADAPTTFKATVPGKDGKPVTKTFALPKLTEDAATKVEGGYTMDLMLRPDDERAQMAIAFATFLACSPKPDVLAALRRLPTPEMLEILGRWMGEASGSSD